MKRLAYSAFLSAALIVSQGLARCQGFQPTTPAAEYIRAGGSLVASIRYPVQFFSDVTPGEEHFAAAHVMRDRGITIGCTATTYCDNDPLTRWQMATFIIRSIYTALNGDPESFTYDPAQRFSDVPPSHPAFKHVQKMAQLGITTGCTATQFCPDSLTTNSQMAVFTVRAWAHIRTNCTSAPDCDTKFVAPPTPYFQDVPFGHPHFNWVQMVRKLNVITAGCTSQLFCPDNSILRGRTAVYVLRALLNDYAF